MDIYQLKFTVLQEEILRFLFIKSGMSFTARAIAKALNVSPTAIAKSLMGLKDEGLIKVMKDNESKRLSIELNKENPEVFHLKRAENLKMIYESKIANFLAESFPGTTIILYGSYSYGEDIINSDVDIAIIGHKEEELSLAKFEKALDRGIHLNFFENFSEININLKNSILNGIVLHGAIQI
jgi:predicted nucleotidyltransferase/biotin operon repressor